MPASAYMCIYVYVYIDRCMCMHMRRNMYTPNEVDLVNVIL